MNKWTGALVQINFLKSRRETTVQREARHVTRCPRISLLQSNYEECGTRKATESCSMVLEYYSGSCYHNAAHSCWDPAAQQLVLVGPPTKWSIYNGGRLDQQRQWVSG